MSDYLNRVEQAKVSDGLRKAVEESTPEDLSAWRDQAIEHNEGLLTGSSYVIDPFDPDAPQSSSEEYMSCLNLKGDGAMGTISIPKIGVDLPIYHGTEGDCMDHGVGHEANSSLPVGGPSTHAVLAGHTGLPSAVIFDKLDKVEEGDYFVLQVLGEDLAYRVSSVETVLPEDTSSLAIQPGKDLVTLVTCTPYGVNTHRLLVHAERCEVPEEWLSRDKGAPAGPIASLASGMGISSVLVGLLVAAGVMGIAGIVVVARRRRGRAGNDRTGRDGRGE